MNLEIQRPTNPAEMYEHFFVPAVFRPLARQVLEAAALGLGQRVLDVACGTGIVAREAAPAVGDAGAVVGLDLRPGMLAVARSTPAPAGARIDWREGDATALEFPSGSFDRVLCQQGLQFFADRAAALREMKRVSVPGGRIVLAVWRGLDRLDFFRGLLEVELGHLKALGIDMDAAALPFSLGDTAELRELCQGAGLTELEIVEQSLHASFPAERFIENTEFGYSAVMPQFVADPALFDSFVAAVSRETEALRERYRVGERLEFPLYTQLVTARA